MKAKNFIFNPGWMEPLRGVEAESCWRIFQAVVAYASDATLPGDELNAIETVSFGYIKADIDRINAKAQDISRKRRAARLSKKTPEECDASDKSQQTETNADKGEKEQEKNKEKEKSLPRTPSLKEKENKKEKEEPPSPPTRACTCEGTAGTATAPADGYPDRMLLARFFDPCNQIRLEALAMKMHVDIDEMQWMAREITDQWVLTGKTHTDYSDASSHLIFALKQMAARDRRERQRIAAEGTPCEDRRGVLGVGEYIDRQGRRTYNGNTFVPPDAGPRPTKGHYWNEITNEWDNIP